MNVQADIESIDAKIPKADDQPLDKYIFDVQLDVDFPRALGIDNQFKYQEPQLLSWLLSLAENDARTTFRLIMGANTHPDPPELPAQVGPGFVEHPNVFSDGSCNMPKQPELALSSAGLFWPKRTLDLSPLEHSYTEPKFVGDGLELRAGVPYFPGSSFRSELVGLITSLYSPCVLHVALDNLGVVKKAQKLLELAKKDHHWRGRPFLLQ
eukprot:4612426-Karenia_brevis.AAC.1